MERPQRGTRARPRLRSVSVQDELKQRIDRGELAAGARLPSEPELAAELQVSRATLREALRAMELEGLLRRRQGSGTFVAEHPRMATSLDVNFGVTDAIRAAGMTAGIVDGRHWVEPAPAGEAALLALEPGQDMLVIERVRTAEGKPVVLSRDLFPSRLVEGADDRHARRVDHPLEAHRGAHLGGRGLSGHVSLLPGPRRTTVKSKASARWNSCEEITGVPSSA